MAKPAPGTQVLEGGGRAVGHLYPTNAVSLLL